MTENSTHPVRHLLLVSFREGTTHVQIRQSMDAFRELTKKIPGIIAFEHGSYTSPEGLNRGMTYAVLVTFENLQARDAYLPHPAHQEFVREHIAMRVEDLLVFDYIPQG